MQIYPTIAAALALIGLAGGPGPAWGQTDPFAKEVHVVRPFEPTIPDAPKINLMPRVDDTVTLMPSFVYNLPTRPIATKFPVTPIPAARMVSEPLPRLYRGHAKLGFGNFRSTVAELYLANERSEQYSFGGWLRHRSALGRIPLDDQTRVDGDLSRNDAGLFGKIMFRRSTLGAEVGLNHRSYLYYGFDTSLVAPFIPTQEDRQAVRHLHAQVNHRSTHRDSAHLNHRVDAQLGHLADRHTVRQRSIGLRAELDRFFDGERVGGTIEYRHRATSSHLDTSLNHTFSFAPWIGLFGEQWRVRAGINFTYEAGPFGNRPHFYPVADLSYDVVSNYFIPYFAFGGHLEENHYAKILAENPWVQPGLNVQNSSHELIITGGIKGNLSARAAYNFSLGYSLIDSLYFFVNLPHDSVPTALGNRFGVIYDNLQRTRAVGEISFAPTPSLNLYLTAEYNIYALQNLEKPWHRPELRARFTASYNIRDKVLVRAAVYHEGKRYARGPNGQPIALRGVVDGNLGIEYRYNSRVSAFLNINNIASQRYHTFHLYPMQGINVKLGATYSFF